MGLISRALRIGAVRNADSAVAETVRMLVKRGLDADRRTKERTP
jgi:hypothetical protein